MRCFACDKRASGSCKACRLCFCSLCETDHWRDCELHPDWSGNLVFPALVHVRGTLIEFQRDEKQHDGGQGGCNVDRQRSVVVAQKEWALGTSVFLWSYFDDHGLVLEYELVHPADLKRKHFLTFSGFVVALLHVRKRHQENVDNGRNELGILPVHRAAFLGSLKSCDIDGSLLDGFGRSVAHWSAMGGTFDRDNTAVTADALWALPIHYWVWAGHLNSGDKFAFSTARDAIGKTMQNGSTLVHLAVLGGVSRKKLLELVGDRKKLFSLADSDRMLPLHVAIRMWNLELTQFFLETTDQKSLIALERDPVGGSLDVDRAVTHLKEGKVAVAGISLFFFACLHGSLDVVNVVMKVASESDRLIAFLLTCALGKIRVVNFLIESGDLTRNCASIIMRDARGNVPSRSKLAAWACSLMPYLNLINLLIEKNVLEVQDLRLCLMEIVKNASNVMKLEAIVNLLSPLDVEIGVLHESTKRDDFAFLKLLLGKNDKESVHPETKRTLLHSACLHGSDDVIKWLLSHKCVRESPLPEDVFGRTLFHDACANCCVATVRALLKIYGNEVLNCRTADGDTPLIYLCRVANWQDAGWRNSLPRRTEVAGLLIESGARTEAQNKWGNAAIHYAVYPVHQAALGILLLRSNGALLNISNRVGISGLQLSQEAREKDLVLVETLATATGLTSSSWARSASSRPVDPLVTPYL